MSNKLLTKVTEITEHLGQFKGRLDFVKAYFDGANNPQDTNTVFRLSDSLSANLNSEQRLKIGEMLNQNPLSSQMMQEKYLAPRYNTEDLAHYAPGTLGYAYYRHLHDNGYDPNFVPVLKVTDDFSYFLRRLGQLHDIWHVVTGFDTSIPGEIGLQAFVAAILPDQQFPISIISGGFLHSVMHNPSLSTPLLDATTQGWQNGQKARPFLAVKWEELWDRSLDELRQEYNIIPFSTLFDFKPEAAEMAG
jgi:ubiquinone biosynthesis protein Coq4